MRSVLFTVLLTLVAAGPAAAAEPIEGTWNFSEGEVVVRATGPGTYTGTVVKATQFATCPHQVGEVMWEIAGSGASYSGGHNWLRDSDCSILAPRGAATWSITSTDPVSFLLQFCTAPPGEGPATPDNPRRRCHTLKRLRPPEPKVTPAVQRQALAEVPSAKRCKSRRAFRIRVKQLKGVTYRSVGVRVNGRAVRVRRAGGRHVATVDLRKLPRGRFTVAIAVVTAEGQSIKATRRYRTCAPKGKGRGSRL